MESSCENGVPPLIWKINTPGLISEIGNCCRDATALKTPLQFLQRMLSSLAEYAANKDDPELNIHMLRLGMYDVPPDELDDAILKQIRKLKN